MWGSFLTVTLLFIGAQAGPLYFQPHDFSQDKDTQEIIESGKLLDKTLCPGGRLSCPNDYTCCKLVSGEWGCCPMKDAVCCPDGVHCCPHGFKCEEKAGKCSKGYQVFSFLQKISANPVEESKSDSKEIVKMRKPKSLIKSVICPDNESECPDGYTCCRMDDDGDSYGCCPLPMAVCCSDKIHCCPSGYTCDVSAGTCTKGHIMLPWVKKVKALVKSIVCPDKQSQCPSGSTCCKLSSGQYGCCPLAKAVCCSDGTHCCPSGYTCDVSAGTCSKGAEKIAWFEKAIATVKSVVCPDKQSECPSGNTCCKLSSGQYGCCPLPKAVCCSDGTHCCPSGYTCDVSAGACSKGAEKVAWFEKSMATVKSVVCPDGQSECPSGNTCCKLSSGQYGCCPLPKAVCCSDGTHCCPSGYTCDVSAGTCSKGAEKIGWFEKSIATVKSVVCPDGQSECPSGNTCCKLSSGQYGCCPLPKAVCCSDGTHCCPSGYTCDVSAGTCSKGDEKIAWFEKSIATVKNVVCPGGQSECPSGNTCCKLSSGQYGCCPLPKAVCCSDGTHCCPSGYTCDVSAGTCSKGAEKIAWFEKAIATVKSVVCPDKQSECPSGNTCCKLSSGQYGCCPLPKAVCCSDGTHCCPSGYTCDVSAGTCSKGAEKIGWFEKSIATVKSVVCPDGQSECPSGNTCCKLSSGQYGCCPLPKAVCCSDGTHCCPSGYTCDVSAGTCSKGAEKIAWFEKAIATVKSVVCPDKQSECPSGNTCCKLSSGQYGCCPLPKAVCCSDGTHCCPSGYTCDVSAGACSKGDEKVAWFEKSMATVKSVVCPDGQSECPSGNTCCKLSSGQYGCCPLPKAVCCSDGTHCCPSGYTCDVSAGTCSKGAEKIGWFEKSIATVKSVVCPDGQSECPSGNTCCKLSSGQYGCCPLPKAVCCSDGAHCCPSGYTCDVSAGTCSKGIEKIALMKKMSDTLKLVICPDGQSECPDGSTCCKLSSGQYGCCPLPKAVCCSDGTHCCPSGYTCDVSAGTCSKGAEKIAWFKKSVATVKNVVCPDGQSECPSGNTCCKLSSGQYGCCPLPKAVCCSDGTHCCPSGYTCDVSAGTCSKGAEKIVWFKKSVATVKNVVCPDGQSECPSGNTCCKLSSGQYGCCPLPKAVCCSDGTHCCPSGYTCDVSTGACSKGAEKVAWFKKSMATVKNVVCPGGQSECPSGNTCCKLSSGQYGCCPLPKAVCCSDGTHCCPSGYTCDVSAGTCSKGAEKIAWFEKSMATVKNVVCPDGQSECPSGNTCCKLSSGQYGCCPLPKAVCCSDGTHCCPSGYTCDVSVGTCSKGAEKIAWLEKAMATVKNVVCPDGQSECPSGNTCCKLSSGQYGCCPLPKAVCCSDGTHCCPSGYTCDVSAGTCSKGAEKIAWLEKAMATVKNVVCPDGQSECPSGNTCCKLSSGQYGCCPLPKAVCCSDGTHCCPSGYTCDVSVGTCSKGTEKIAWFEKAVVTVKNVLCPGGQSECPSGNTCCKLSSGQYGCCSFPKAVCCSDGVHCCPSGYTCDPSSGTCNKGAFLISTVRKTVAKVAAPPRITCPDERWSCEDSTTCCKMSDGGYGCCPVINAVCCNDHIHCCPHHTTCDTKLERCVAGDGSFQPWSKKAKAESVKSVAPAAEGNVLCPDGTSYCRSGQTCCKSGTGRWACCPLPKAVCCSDHIHCCPNGYSCDTASGKCNKGNLEMPLVEKVEASLRKDQDCGGNVTCSQENTCCMMKTGDMGCCPVPNAVCCLDGLHCCPAGMICGKGDKKCIKKDGALDESFPLKTKSDHEKGLAKRMCSPYDFCRDEETCCKSGKRWKCCRFRNATCCKDGRHCCREGYRCTKSGHCWKGHIILPWLQTQQIP